MPERFRGEAPNPEQMAWLGLDEWQEAQFISGDQYHDAERRELILWLIEDDSLAHRG